MFSSIITESDERHLVLDTREVVETAQYAAWSDCWNELLVQQIGCYELNRECPVQAPFDGRLWALQAGELIWFCTEHDPLTTYIKPKHIAQQRQALCLLLMVQTGRHFQQKNHGITLTPDRMLLLSQDIPTVSHSLQRQKTIGLVIPQHLLESGLRQNLQQRMQLIDCQSGIAHALAGLLLSMPKNLRGVDSVLQRQQFSAHVLGLLHLSLDLGHRVLEKTLPQLHYQTALNLMECHLRNPRLCCAFIARHLGISESYLYKLFQQQGRRFSDELKTRRLRGIAQALRNPAFAHLSISQLAYHYGFNSINHFNRLFKTVYGCSPSAYRREE